MTKNILTFVIQANKIHNSIYDYSKSVYLTTDDKIEIICKDHGSFWQRASAHIGKQKQGCPKCSKTQKMTLEVFVERANIKHSKRYDYSKSIYTTARNKIEIVCQEHGSFWQVADSHLAGNKCSSCAGVKYIGLDKFIERAEKIHDSKYNYSKVIYKDNKTKVEIICPIHGSFWQESKSHLNGFGCSTCAGFNITPEIFIERASNIHANKYDYSKVILSTAKIKIEIICSKHGSFWQTPDGHLAKKGCVKCSKMVSKKETFWLNSLGIPDDKEHRQVKLPFNNGKKYKVDGFNPITNTIYEFWGDYWHGNPEIYNPQKLNHFGKTFGELYEKTQNKINAIQESGYNLVQIWESEWKN